MKFSKSFLSKSLLGASLFVIGSVAATSHAQTTTVPSGCSWTTVSVQSGPSSAIVNTACQLNGVSIATREQRYSAYNPQTCSITWVASGYVSSGACDSVQILKIVQPVCYSGTSVIIQTSPTNHNPVFNAASVCGHSSCPYTVQPLDNYSYPRLKYTCS